jgi:hypothetical protein
MRIATQRLEPAYAIAVSRHKTTFLSIDGSTTTGYAGDRRIYSFYVKREGEVAPSHPLYYTTISYQQFVHILGPRFGGKLSATLSGTPTENVDMSFCTFPWQMGQFTWVSMFITSLSNL